MLLSSWLVIVELEFKVVQCEIVLYQWHNGCVVQNAYFLNCRVILTRKKKKKRKRKQGQIKVKTKVGVEPMQKVILVNT